MHPRTRAVLWLLASGGWAVACAATWGVIIAACSFVCVSLYDTVATRPPAADGVFECSVTLAVLIVAVAAFLFTDADPWPMGRIEPALDRGIWLWHWRRRWDALLRRPKQRAPR